MGLETAAIVSLASVAATAGQTGASFAQASKQKKLQREAESEAAKFLADARKKLDVNFYEQLGIQKEPYELAREAALSSGAQLIEAGRESERGAAATAGRIQMAQQEEQRKIASAMGQEMQGLEKLTAQEEGRLRDMQANLDIRESAGAQRAAAVAEARSAQALQQGIQGVGKLATDAFSLLPDYQKTAGQKQFGKISEGAKEAGLSQQQFQQQLAAFGMATPTYGNLSSVGGMNPIEFQNFMAGLSPEFLKRLGNLFNPTGIYNSPIIGGQGTIGPME
jgi:hypothetical protein